MRSSLRSLACGAALCGAAAALGQTPPPVIALTGGRVITVSGPPIDGGVVLIRDGVIEAVGDDVELPFDAVEIDVTGKVVMPAPVVAATQGGLDVSNESLPVTPFLNVFDAINPADRDFEDALRFGHAVMHVLPGRNCVIGGVGRIVRPIGLSVGEMTIEPDTALALATTPKNGLDRMAQMATLREAFAEYEDYKGRRAEERYEEDLEERDETLKVSPEEAREAGMALLRDEDYDDKHYNLMRLLRGDLGAWFYCEQAMDVAPALEVAAAQELTDRTVLMVGADAHKAVDEIKASGRPAVLSSSLYHRERDVITGELRETFTPKVFNDAGVLFALRPAGGPFGGGYAERQLTYQAAVCVREGMSRGDALEAITLNPAKIVGLGDRYGSLEAGKSGTLVVYSGDPLDFSSWVEHVYIDGVHAYDRERDHVLQRLLKLERDIDADRQAEAAKEADADDADNADGADDADNAGDAEGDGSTDAGSDAP